MAAIPPPLDNSPAVARTQPSPSQSEFKCGQCGANLVYQPGIHSLRCEYCEFENPIPTSEDEIEELDFRRYLAQLSEHEIVEEQLVLKCSSCGAESIGERDTTSQHCPFCDSEIVTTAQSKKQIKPRSLLPFKVVLTDARDYYKKWLTSLWFAPNKLIRRARIELKLNGLYVPHWTYDADTISYYVGERGEHYYVTETRTRTVDGRTETYTEQVQHTRWYPASGTVTHDFNDVLIPASKSLPEKYLGALEPWDLENLEPYQDQFLSGFRAESYQIGLADGFELAKDVMADVIRQNVRRHIGGDEQRIISVKTQHNRVTFKHILLPVWLSAYRYKEKVYRFMVNARTGEVQGERPWSWLKITLAGLGVIAIVVGLYFGYQYWHINNP